MSRRATCVVVRVTGPDGIEILYGPFLPHVGSKCSWFVSTLESYQSDAPDRDRSTIEIIDVFIGEGESDGSFGTDQ